MRKYGTWFNIPALCMVLCFSIAIPQSLHAQADDGIELFNSGAYESAEPKLRATLDAEPDNTTVRYYLGLTLQHLEKYSEALKELKRVKSEQEKASQWSRSEIPNVYQIDLALAKAHLALEQYGEAWPKIESARTEDASSSEVFLYRGIYYYKQEEHSKAIEDLEKAISLDPENAYAYYYVGEAYYKIGEPQKMIEVFNKFLQLVPDAPEASYAQAQIDSCM